MKILRVWAAGLAVVSLTLATPVAAKKTALTAPTLKPSITGQGTVTLAWRYKGRSPRKTTSVQIERSTDGSTFAPRVTVAKAGRRGRWNDDPLPGTFWYRARVVSDTQTTAWGPAVSATVADETEPGGPSACPDGYLAEVVDAVNALRAKANVAPLADQAQLALAADVRSVTLAETGVLSHDGWVSVIRAAGYAGGLVGENIAYGYRTPGAVVKGWNGSSGHRANMLNPGFRFVGVGCTIDARGIVWWVQDLGG